MKAIFGVADTVFSSYMCIWVFVAKYRRRVFDACAIDVLRGIFAEVCSDAQTTLVEMDGEDDHVHVEYPPKLAISSLVNSLKSVSSRLLRQQRPDIRKRYWRGGLWSPATSHPPAAERPSASSANTSSCREYQTDIHDSFAVGAILSALKDGACRALWSIASDAPSLAMRRYLLRRSLVEQQQAVPPADTR